MDNQQSASTDAEKARDLIADHLSKEVEAYRAGVHDLDRWLATSMLAINGGALVALASLDRISAPVLKASGQWFVAGIVAAYLSAGATAHVGRKLSMWYTEQIAHSAGTGTQSEIDRLRRLLDRHILMASVLRVLSVALFVVGVVVIGDRLDAPVSPVTQKDSSQIESESPPVREKQR